MNLKMHISPRIISNIASIYTDVNRIILEYVDNSLDSAEVFYDSETGKYRSNIHIQVRFEGHNFKNGKITIEDNCFGITNFPKLVENFGNSDKKKEFTTNGEFGFGVYSYLAACKLLTIESSLKGDANKIILTLPSKIFEVDRQEDVIIPEVKMPPHDSRLSGTKITLSEFDKSSWKEMTCDKIVSEIENHFEFILKRKNLRIEVIEGNERRICRPFDYSSLDGSTFHYTLKDILIYKSGKREQEVNIHKPVNISLTFTPNTIVNKPPVFIIKGRRIAAIKNVSSFKSKHKSDIWGHPHLTGYVELPNTFSPNLARTDFKQKIWTKALYSELKELEPYILEDLKKINQKEASKHYQHLSEELTKALAALAKEDKIYEQRKGISTTPAPTGGIGSEFEDGFGGKDKGGERSIQNPGKGVGLSEGEGAGLNNDGGDQPSSAEGGDKPLQTEFADEENKKKKSGISVKIIDNKPPQDHSDENKFYRSYCDENRQICIFRYHKDFQDRIKTKRDGSEIISSRLINYLANEVTVHYKDIFYNKYGQPDYSLNLFIDMVDFIYRIEEQLKDLNGRNLSEI